MDEHILICIFVFLTGACIGSFLNVVALRALSKESIVLPPSKCPKCNTPIKWYDNIPILSYFLTFRGKCRSCGEKVSIQYPIVETLTALIFLAVFLAFGISLKTLLLLIILCTSIVIIITDIKEEAIFDVHSWILIISAIVFSSLDKNISFALIGCIIGAIFMEIVARASYFLVKKEDNEGQEGYEIDKILYYISYAIYKHNQYLTGIQLPVKTRVGKGLTFAHFSNIVIASTAIIGENTIIYNGVTIGTVHTHKGAPVLGNNIVLYTGCKILGDVKIGNNVIIGANAVVTKDIPDNSVAVGIPAKVISDKGQEYFNLVTNRID